MAAQHHVEAAVLAQLPQRGGQVAQLAADRGVDIGELARHRPGGVGHVPW